MLGTSNLGSWDGQWMDNRLFFSAFRLVLSSWNAVQKTIEAAEPVPVPVPEAEAWHWSYGRDGGISH